MSLNVDEASGLTYWAYLIASDTERHKIKTPFAMAEAMSQNGDTDAYLSDMKSGTAKILVS